MLLVRRGTDFGGNDHNEDENYVKDNSIVKKEKNDDADNDDDVDVDFSDV